MVNDSVREELASKISPIVKTPRIEVPRTEAPRIDFRHEVTKIELKEKPSFTPAASEPVPMVNKPLTSEIRNKQTNPTLVEFHTASAALPEWRLQLQNAVRRRHERYSTDASSTTFTQTAPHRTNLVTSGATALKAEPIEQIEPVISSNPIVSSNPRLAKAMQRIEQSRQKFYVEEIQPAVQVLPAQPAPKTFPHAVPNRSNEFFQKTVDTDAATNINVMPVKTEMIAENRTKFDTNKLPPLPNISSGHNGSSISITKVDLNLDDDNFLEIHTSVPASIHTTAAPEVVAYSEHQIAEPLLELGDEDIDDCAPFSLRFNSAIFDLIIGSFASLLLLSPFMLVNGKFFSFEGAFAFLATCSFVMFIYLTATIGLLGRTFGMKLFSLEVVDIDENAYPTLHQAAVSSAVYILSLAFGGLGFVTLFMNSEKRAAHDLLSGTIIVKEYQS